jgi:hypothetical protein
MRSLQIEESQGLFSPVSSFQRPLLTEMPSVTEDHRARSASVRTVLVSTPGNEAEKKENSRSKPYLYCRKIANVGSYQQLYKITAEAIQQLYWACRTKADFPGVLPDESSGHVTTNAILHGLGLVGSTCDESGLPLELIDPVDNPSDNDNKSAQNSNAQGKPGIPGTSTMVSGEYSSSPESHEGDDMQTQSKEFSHQTSPILEKSQPATTSNLVPQVSKYKTGNMLATTMPATDDNITGPFLDIDSFFDIDSFIDVGYNTLLDSSASIADLPPLNHLTSQHSQHETLPVQATLRVAGDIAQTPASAPASAPAMADQYLAPWPGSLAAAYSDIAMAR